MQCDEAREAISAAADGEAHPLERSMIDAHVARCPACAAYAASVAQLDRYLRIRPAEPVPDLSSAILAGSTAAGNKPVREWPRYVLLWVALTGLVLALPALAGAETGASVHAAHELGSWEAALSIGLLVAAWQPRRAAGLLPFALALAGAMLVTAGFDIFSGHVVPGAEAQHVLDIVGVGALWVMTRSTLPTTSSRFHRRLRAA